MATAIPKSYGRAMRVNLSKKRGFQNTAKNSPYGKQLKVNIMKTGTSQPATTRNQGFRGMPKIPRPASFQNQLKGLKTKLGRQRG